MQEHADINLFKSAACADLKLTIMKATLTIRDDKTLQFSSEHIWHCQEQRKTRCRPARWTLNQEAVWMDDLDNF